VGLEDARIHDLRPTYASTGAGLSLPAIGRLLGYTQIASTECFVHLADDPVRKATKTIGGLCKLRWPAGLKQKWWRSSGSF
jgi:site-specific recombinase XerD